jgi:hypothetical protein
VGILPPAGRNAAHHRVGFELLPGCEANDADAAVGLGLVELVRWLHGRGVECSHRRCVLYSSVLGTT